MLLLNRMQRITLYLFLFSLNFEMFVPFDFVGITVSRFFGILYFMTLIPEIRLFVRTDRIRNIIFWAWGFFGLFTLISLININEVSKIFFNMSMFQNILLFWFLVNHARKDFLILEKGLLMFAIGSIVLSIMYLMRIGVEYSFDQRLIMFGENENALGLRMSIGAIIIILAVIQDKLAIGKIRYLFLVPLPLMISFIFATGSRLAFTSFILTFIAGIVLIKTKNSADKIAAISIGIVSLIILSVFLMQSELMSNRLLNSVQSGDSSGRDVIWRKLLPLIKAKPIFGVGQTGYSSYSLFTFGELRSPHNVIIEVICLTGFIGLIVYFSFLQAVFIKGYQTYRKSGLLLPLLLFIPILMTHLTGQMLERKLGWIIYAYMVGSIALKSTLPKKNNNEQSVDNSNL